MSKTKEQPNEKFLLKILRVIHESKLLENEFLS